MKLANVTPKTKIRHRNEINTTFSMLPLSARRILFMAIAQLDSKKMLEQGQTFRISAKEYSLVADVDISVAYKQLKEGANELQTSIISIPKSQLLEPFARAGDPLLPKKGKKSPVDTIRSLNLTEYCDYADSESTIELSFSRHVEPYICRLKDNYTTQVLLSTVRLTESNASALYQLIRKNISAGKINYFDISVDELKDEMNLYKVIDGEKVYSYPEFKIFNRDFIKKNVDMINKMTEIQQLKYEVIEKVARKASKLRFTYSVSKDSEAEDEFSDEAVEAVTKEEVKLSRPHSKRDINEISEPDTQIPPGFRG
ncbi:Initiator Replication protein [Serratia sp. JKS296]|uniref:replication initiation protein n=1 Tax=Serratia sp. JKS296 TaxID=1938824 RepID=UPI000BCC763B|nr:RepB family plasmid replication initiator protein [Serratia sp. JKS296]MBH2581088.1 RepB family plasmid replication initiator protein [Serratia marcescens]SOD79869.1 Initiator Replication protein [Serratia sp. JKS296]